MVFDYHKPQSDRCHLRCGYSWGDCTSNQPPFEFDCTTGAIETVASPGLEPYYFNRFEYSASCALGNCGAHNENGNCIFCRVGNAPDESNAEFSFCQRSCPSECGEVDTILDGIGGYSTIEDVDTSTPLESWLGGGEVYLELKSYTNGSGEARLAYVLDSAHYEPGDPVEDSVEWGDTPIITSPAAVTDRRLYTVANMYNTKVSGRCTYPGVGDGAGTSSCRGASSPQYVCNQSLSFVIDIGPTDGPSPICRWQTHASFWDDMNGMSKCTAGSHGCGNIPVRDGTGDCTCAQSGSFCQIGGTCGKDWPDTYQGDCCNHLVGPDGSGNYTYGTNDGGPCDACHRAGSNEQQDGEHNQTCCRCQVEANGSPCVRWKANAGVGPSFSGGLGSVGGTELVLFNSIFDVTDNIECFSDPIDPDNFHLWGGIKDTDGPAVTWLNYYPAPDWSTIETPRDLIDWRYLNGAFPTLTYNTQNMPTVFGFIRITGFEVISA
tara:strand:+ start:1106 stop:2578 length:1473 start_codon:yes stop_codon:yes gene_type:complete